MTLFAPTMRPNPLPLFSPFVPSTVPPTLIRTPQQAIQNACRRWPALAERVRDAAALTDANVLYTYPSTPHILAWCWEQERWRYHQLTETNTGLACTCPAWPPAVRAGPGDGCYCPHILAWLLTVYLRRPLPLLPFSAEGLWQRALADLKLQMTKGTYETWFARSQAVPGTSTPFRLTVSVTNWMAQDWLTHRLYRVIQRALSAQAGYRMDVTFVVRE